MMNSDQLRDYYKQLLEATQEPTVDSEALEIQDTTAPDIVDNQEVMVAQEKAGPRFPPNPHRFAYQQGEVVHFYDDAGNLIKGTIAGPPVGDRYDVADAQGNRQEVLKSELFYPAEDVMAEQPVADEENTA